MDTSILGEFCVTYLRDFMPSWLIFGFPNLAMYFERPTLPGYFLLNSTDSAKIYSNLLGRR